MSNAYIPVQWNRHKRLYDLFMLAGIVCFLLAFVFIGKLTHTGPRAIADEVLVLRALAVCAFVLLHIILCIGPLARLSPRFAPLLYNRRHLGVTMFVVALSHALLATGYYGAFGGVLPLWAVLASGDPRSISGFPFEWMGLLALIILFVLAATSHDFWLKFLSPRLWKWLHMGVYMAYAALVLHVALGILQSERAPGYTILLLLGVTIVATLHTLAAIRQWRLDRTASRSRTNDLWLEVPAWESIRDGRAATVRVPGTCAAAIAVYRQGDTFHAVSNVCTHQGGPLGEGKIVDGCITCPWHGYQFLPHNGQSPPPFTEKIPTYELRVRGGQLEVSARPLPPGTPTEAIRRPPTTDASQDAASKATTP